MLLFLTWPCYQTLHVGAINVHPMLSYKKICNRLLDEKLQAIRDLQIWRSLMTLNYTEVWHNICLFLIQHFNVGFRQIELSPHKHYAVTTTYVGLIFSLPTEGRILQVTSTNQLINLIQFEHGRRNSLTYLLGRSSVEHSYTTHVPHY